MKHLYINNLVTFSNKDLILLSMFNWGFALQHTCPLKLNLLSKSTVTSFTTGSTVECQCLSNVKFIGFCVVSKKSLYYHCLKFNWIGKHLVYCEPVYCDFWLLSKNFIHRFDIFNSVSYIVIIYIIQKICNFIHRDCIISTNDKIYRLKDVLADLQYYQGQPLVIKVNIHNTTNVELGVILFDLYNIFLWREAQSEWYTPKHHGTRLHISMLHIHLPLCGTIICDNHLIIIQDHVGRRLNWANAIL